MCWLCSTKQHLASKARLVHYTSLVVLTIDTENMLICLFVCVYVYKHTNTWCVCVRVQTQFVVVDASHNESNFLINYMSVANMSWPQLRVNSFTRPVGKFKVTTVNMTVDTLTAAITSITKGYVKVLQYSNKQLYYLLLVSGEG